MYCTCPCRLAMRLSLVLGLLVLGSSLMQKDEPENTLPHISHTLLFRLGSGAVGPEVGRPMAAAPTSQLPTAPQSLLQRIVDKLSVVSYVLCFVSFAKLLCMMMPGHGNHPQLTSGNFQHRSPVFHLSIFARSTLRVTPSLNHCAAASVRSTP